MSSVEHIVNDDETRTTTEDLPNDSCKSEAKLMNQTDTALLDDEEMPTYISMSSTSRPDDSDVVNPKQQEDLSQEANKDHKPSSYPSDDESSVYVLSSDEDTDQHPSLRNDEDDEDEYNTDDMENLELEEFEMQHPHKHLMEEEDDDEDDEEEEEDDDLKQMYDDDDEEEEEENIINHDRKVDSMDVRSDDFILNRTLKKCDKSKSLSLQDLNECSGINHNAERRRSHIFKQNISQSAVMFLDKKQQPKYHHVQSKVKLYINSIKEQSKRSIERHTKAYQENGMPSNSDHKNGETKEMKLKVTNAKIIKPYAERTIKELEIVEECNNDKTVDNVAPVILNGQDNKNSFEMIQSVQNEINIPFESTENKKDTTNGGDNMNNDYVIEQEDKQTEIYHNIEPMDLSDDDTSYTLINENVKSVKTVDDEIQSNNQQMIFNKISEERKTNCNTFEVIELRDQLSKKTVQYNNLLEAYQKQLTDNMSMKGELSKLRKSLAKYKKESESREQKTISIQTDIADSALNEYNNQAKPAQMKQSNNKISTNSVVSTLSSIGEWSDSAGNLSISMKPPEPVKASHSDDSIPLTDSTPGKTRLSTRAFLTSSRILQTLANITQGKINLESPLVQNSKKRLNEQNVSVDLHTATDGSCESQPSCPKKRKTTDVAGPSSFIQSLKVPQTESHSRLNESSNMEFKFKSDSVSEKVNESQESDIKTSQSETMESITENADDFEDNVKCFVYHENENSKNRSFLIQAESPEKDKGQIRECGPYILGNVEVRMSEINGTLNIWGKEINQESTAEAENETDIPKIKINKGHSWQRISHTRFNGNNLVCSTGKKLKTPSRFDSTFNHCSHASSSFNNMAGPSCSTDKARTKDFHSPNVQSSCEVCDSSRYPKEWSKYKRIQEKSHSCCVHNMDVEQKYCNCFLHRGKLKFENNCSKEKLNVEEQRCSLSRNFECGKHLHENMTNPAAEDNEPMCRCHHSLHEPKESEESCRRNCRCKRESCICEPLTNTDREVNESCNHSLNEEEPLITLNQCSETSEAKRRRLSGKRVRGILMDFLRGCGDCYTPSVSSSSKGCVHKKNSHLTNCSSQIKITPCTSPEPTCSNSGQPIGRCCHAYAQRIESQLEEFQVEMEKVRTRSDAILNILNMLHSVD